MSTEMSILIEVKNCTDSKQLYDELKRYKLNVIDMGAKTVVHATIDIRDDAMENIIKVCNKYGSCYIEAHLVGEKDS